MWLEAEPYPVEVFADHLEPLRLASLDDLRASHSDWDGKLDAPPCRVARLRSDAERDYPGIPRGVWLCAGALVPPVKAEREPASSDRRRHRLPDGVFEFRTEVLSR